MTTEADVPADAADSDVGGDYDVGAGAGYVAAVMNVAPADVLGSSAELPL